MKKIIFTLSILMSIGSSAQMKKVTVQKTGTASEVTTTAVSNEMAAKLNMNALTKFVTISPEMQSQLLELFTTKYRMLAEVANSDERKKYIADIIAAKLEGSLDGNLLSKIKSNTSLYQSLLQ